MAPRRVEAKAACETHVQAYRARLSLKTIAFYKELKEGVCQSLCVSPMRIVHLDHSGLPGGGQLGLRRFVGTAELRHAHTVVVLTPGPVVDAIGEAGGDVLLQP